MKCRRQAAAYSRSDTWVINPAPTGGREKNLGGRRVAGISARHALEDEARDSCILMIFLDI